MKGEDFAAMLKASAMQPNGRPILVIGLSFANLKRFKEQPRDTYIHIDGTELDLPVDVTIFSGESEAAMGRFMADFIGPNTKTNIDKRSTDA